MRINQDRPFLVDGPKGFFGCGVSSIGYVFRDSFDAYIDALRKLGKTVHVYEDHAPVYAVIEPLKKVAA